MMSNIGSDTGEQMISGAVKIGTETLKLTGTVTKGIMDFIMQIIKIRNEQQRNAAHSEKDPLSKVKYGEIDLKNLLKLERKENIQMAHASFPAEHEQAFEAAISEAAVLKEQLKNIDIISFEQTQDLDNLDYVIDNLPVTDNNRTAELILKDINDKMTDEQRLIFNYAPEKTEIIYADISNIGALRTQYAVSQLVTSPSYINKTSENPPKGNNTLVYDKNTNKYLILPQLTRIAFLDALRQQMNYDCIKAAICRLSLLTKTLPALKLRMVLLKVLILKTERR